MVLFQMFSSINVVEPLGGRSDVGYRRLLASRVPSFQLERFNFRTCFQAGAREMMNHRERGLSCDKKPSCRQLFSAKVHDPIKEGLPRVELALRGKWVAPDKLLGTPHRERI